MNSVGISPDALCSTTRLSLMRQGRKARGMVRQQCMASAQYLDLPRRQRGGPPKRDPSELQSRLSGACSAYLQSATEPNKLTTHPRVLDHDPVLARASQSLSPRTRRPASVIWM